MRHGAGEEGKATVTDDAERDADRDEWNAALASGDAERIEATRDRMLRKIATRIAREDGWGDE